MMQVDNGEVESLDDCSAQTRRGWRHCRSHPTTPTEKIQFTFLIVDRSTDLRSEKEERRRRATPPLEIHHHLRA